MAPSGSRSTAAWMRRTSASWPELEQTRSSLGLRSFTPLIQLQPYETCVNSRPKLQASGFERACDGPTCYEQASAPDRRHRYLARGIALRRLLRTEEPQGYQGQGHAGKEGSGRRIG